MLTAGWLCFFDSPQDVNQSIYEHITKKQLPSRHNPTGVLGWEQRNTELLLWDVDLMRLDGNQLPDSQTYNGPHCGGRWYSIVGKLCKVLLEYAEMQWHPDRTAVGCVLGLRHITYIYFQALVKQSVRENGYESMNIFKSKWLQRHKPQRSFKGEFSK